MAPPPRLCPACGQSADGPLCPRDGTATVSLDALATARHDLDPGTIVCGKYRIVREIARGGHGVVYLADHLLGLGPVALKLPRRESPSVESLRRFFREAQVSARLQGEMFARVLDVGQTEAGALYLALEYIDGCTLEAYLRDRLGQSEVLSEAEATRIALHVLDGLQIAHAAGLVHRDLKPSNIALRASDGAVKILDFGLALVEDSSLTPSEHALGTPDYMSPEQCQGEPVDGRADLYALGVVLYRSVVGHTPFRAQTAMAVMWGHVHKPPADVTSVAPVPLSPQFAQLIMRALAKQPADRFADAGQMSLALVEPDLPLPSWAPLPTTEPHRGDRAGAHSGTQTVSVALQPTRPRRRWWLAAAGVGLAGALAGLVARQPEPSGTRARLPAAAASAARDERPAPSAVTSSSSGQAVTPPARVDAAPAAAADPAKAATAAIAQGPTGPTRQVRPTRVPSALQSGRAGQSTVAAPAPARVEPAPAPAAESGPEPPPVDADWKAKYIPR